MLGRKKVLILLIALISLVLTSLSLGQGGETSLSKAVFYVK